MSEPGCSNKCHGISGICYLNDGNIRWCIDRLFHNQNLRSLGYYIRYKFMSIHNSASDTDKQRTFCHFSGVINNTGNFLLGISLYAGVF